MERSYPKKYVKTGKTEIDLQKLKFVKCDTFAPGFMVWAGVSFYSKMLQIFIDRGINVNADYHINKVLKPFLAKAVPRLFPGREGDLLLHQDLASSYMAKKTIS